VRLIPQYQIDIAGKKADRLITGWMRAFLDGLFYGHGFRQIPGLIDVAALPERYMIGE
jgi:hypothetical protein